MSEPEPPSSDGVRLERVVASEAQAKALASVVRLRILRVCLHEPRTNREIAAALGLHPATALHHVRRLVDTGFLAPEPPRTGRRGAREVPYRATRLSWRVDTPQPLGAPPLLAAFLADVDGLPPGQVDLSRLGLKVAPERLAELRDRLFAVLEELAAEPSDPAGEAWSVFVALHPDRTGDAVPLERARE